MGKPGDRTRPGNFAGNARLSAAPGPPEADPTVGPGGPGLLLTGTEDVSTLSEEDFRGFHQRLGERGMGMNREA